MKVYKKIQNCQGGLRRIKKPCPRLWDNLVPLESDRERYCESCDKSVYYCDTDEQAVVHAKQGHCIAMQVSDSEFSETRYIVGESEASTYSH